MQSSGEVIVQVNQNYNSCWPFVDNKHSIVVRQSSIISQFEGNMITQGHFHVTTLT